MSCLIDHQDTVSVTEYKSDSNNGITDIHSNTNEIVNNNTNTNTNTTTNAHTDTTIPPIVMDSNKIGRKLAPYNPTNKDAVDMALK